jgi:hypothetical protein
MCTAQQVQQQQQQQQHMQARRLRFIAVASLRNIIYNAPSARARLCNEQVFFCLYIQT